LRQAMGQTPINPRRSTPRKPEPVQQELKLPARPKTGVTKADLVREIIRKNKSNMTQETLVEVVVSKLGFTRSLASTYVRNNWSRA